MIAIVAAVTSSRRALLTLLLYSALAMALTTAALTPVDATHARHHHYKSLHTRNAHREAVFSHSSLHRESHANTSHIKHPSNGDAALWALKTAHGVSSDEIATQVRSEIERTLGVHFNSAPFACDRHPHHRLPHDVVVCHSAEGVDHSLVSLSLTRAVSSHLLWWFDRQSSRRHTHRDTRTDAMAEPLFASQWHLHDGTQRTGYYEQAHLAQDHLGVQGVWKQQVYGVGVTVAVVDDGLDHAHADFSGRYQPALSHDYNSNDEDPAPRSLDSHGTSAAGLIAAGASDHTCGVGVAPLAAIAGIRLIADYVDDYTEALALTRRDDAVAVYSNSWGPADDGARLEAPGVLTQLAMEEAVRSGRNGLGTVYVWASGNGRHHGDSCAYDGYASSRLVIAVGAVGYFGNAAYYSEGCAALLCVAPSSASEGPDDVRRVTSSDLRGSYGATSGDCTGDFGGTSAAAPLVAGVVALLLSKVPTLGWRDVQHLIAHTAVRVDATHPSWRKNAADLWFSHLYGFGRVNASAALELALQWSPLPATELVVVTNTSANFSSLPVAAGLRASELTLRIDEQLTIEFVDVYLSIDHPRRGALEIMLTSPAGTVSELASLHPDTNANYAMWRFGSRAVLGERAAGTWRLSVRDIASAVSRGNVRYAELRVYGHTV